MRAHVHLLELPLFILYEPDPIHRYPWGQQDVQTWVQLQNLSQVASISDPGKISHYKSSDSVTKALPELNPGGK
jgi:hypothetical protein